jgi:hypothetical protein
MELMVRSVTYLEKLLEFPDWQDRYRARAIKERWSDIEIISDSEPGSVISSRT